MVDYDSYVSPRMSNIEEDTSIPIITSKNLYPNPTNTSVSFNYDLKKGQKGIFNLYSISGQLIYNQIITNETNQINIPLPTIDNGIYFVSFSVDYKPVFNEKLIIIK
jgi:hypothetical protein